MIRTAAVARRKRAEKENTNHKDLEDPKGASALAINSSAGAFFEVFAS